MKKEDHILYYFSLIGVIIFGVILMFNFSPNRNLQMLTLIGLSIAYIVLGIIHHLINHDLVLKIVIEYILIASLGIAAAFFIYKGGFGF